MKPERGFEGVWWLLSRNDQARDGSPREEPTLGSDALGILTYANGRFAAQFMKRDRRNVEYGGTLANGPNNTTAVGGYDAYFGTYRVDPSTGQVIHRLQGALNAANIGLEVARSLTVAGNKLEIRLDTSTLEGEPVTRTLIWQRIG